MFKPWRILQGSSYGYEPVRKNLWAFISQLIPAEPAFGEHNGVYGIVLDRISTGN